MLTVTDDKGATDTATKTVTVKAPNVKPTAAFTSSAEQPGGELRRHRARTDSDGTIAGYAWDFGDNTTGTGVQAAATPTAAPGTYPVKLTVTDNDGRYRLGHPVTGGDRSVRPGLLRPDGGLGLGFAPISAAAGR